MSFENGKILIVSSSSTSGDMRFMYDCLIRTEEECTTIVYHEKDDQTAITRIDITEEGVTMQRKGDISNTMFFSEKKKFKTNLITQYGELPMKIYTNTVEVKKIGNKLIIYVNYDICYTGKDKDNIKLSINVLQHKKTHNLEEN